MQVANNFFKRWSDNKLTKQVETKQVETSDADTKSEIELDAGPSLTPLPKGQFVEVNTEETQQADALENDVVTDKPLGISIEQGSESTDPQQVESLSVANILADGIKGSVKKQALRNLFLSGEFSEVDRLNDYDHDYQAVKSLSADATSQLRNWLNDKADDETEPNDSDLTDEQMTTEQERETPDENDAKPEDVNEEIVSSGNQNRELVVDSYGVNNENYSGLAGAGDK